MTKKIKFYAVGSPAVWDATQGKVLCRFKNGLFETDNEYVIDKLETCGYSKKPVKQPARRPEHLQPITDEGEEVEIKVDAEKIQSTKIVREDHKQTDSIADGSPIIEQPKQDILSDTDLSKLEEQDDKSEAN